MSDTSKQGQRCMCGRGFFGYHLRDCPLYDPAEHSAQPSAPAATPHVPIMTMREIVEAESASAEPKHEGCSTCGGIGTFEIDLCVYQCLRCAPAEPSKG